MLDRKTIEKLGGWEGYRVERIAWPEGDSRTVTIYLKPSARTMYCQHCGNRCRQVHETTVRRVRDLPLMALQVRLVVPATSAGLVRAVRWSAAGEAELAGPLPASHRPAGRGGQPVA